MRKKPIIIILLISFNIILAKNYAQNQIIVKIDKNVNFDIIKKDLDVLGFEINAKLFDHLNIFLTEYDSSIYADINNAITMLQTLSFVIYSQKILNMIELV